MKLSNKGKQLAAGSELIIPFHHFKEYGSDLYLVLSFDNKDETILTSMVVYDKKPEASFFMLKGLIC